MARPHSLCPTCGRARVSIDAHHVAREENAPDLTVEACRGECHPIETERALEASVAGDRGQPAGDSELAWAVMHGLADMLFLFAFHAPTLGKEAAEISERMVAQLGRIVDMADRHTGGSGIEGPDPHGNDLRRARRRGRQVRYRLEPDNPAPAGGDPTTSAERGAVILRTIAEAGQYLPDHVYPPGLSERLLQLAAQAPALEARLIELEPRDSPAVNELFGRLREENLFLGGPQSPLLGVGEVGDLVALWPRLGSIPTLAEGLLALGLQLGAAADADAAEALIERFLSALES